MKIFRWLMLLGIVASLAPFAALFLAASLAEAHSCRLHESQTTPCLIWGADWGATLYNVALGGWLAMFLTLPIAAFLALAWIAVELALPILRSGRGNTQA